MKILLSKKQIMENIVFLTLFLFMIPPVFGKDKQGETPVFTDRELETYRKPSDIRKPAERPVTSETSITSSTIADNGQPLERHEIPYKAFEGSSRRIIIPVRLENSVIANMALDTGSPGMIISDRLAKKLGIFERDDGMLITYAAGIGGSAPAVLTIIEKVQVDKAEDHFVPTIITQSLSDAFDGLIGLDFMANYSIKIDTIKHVVIFEELQKRKNMPAGHDEIWWRTNFRRFALTRSEWKKYRENLNTQKGDAQKLRALKDFADRQYREADKLFNKLNSYAITHSVPMQWREF
ncbi:MAG: retropepsin-like aspartic protease [Nitrospirota bacterium]